MTLSVCDIMWCWWQISKCLWYIGRLILATDNCSTYTDLSHCHPTDINTRQRNWQWTQASLLTCCCLTTCLCLLFCVLINLKALVKNHKCCLRTHKFIPKINAEVCLPLDQLFSVHSLWMHKDHNALHYRSHTALRNWWLGVQGAFENCFLSLVKNTKVTLYIYCTHSATQ